MGDRRDAIASSRASEEVSSFLFADIRRRLDKKRWNQTDEGGIARTSTMAKVR